MTSLNTRRNFLKASGIAATSGLVLAQSGHSASNDRLRLGMIGCGGRGYWHCRDIMDRTRQGKPVEIVAVCDIYERRKARAQDATGAKVFHDYRDLLQEKDIDAVVISAPDHWHHQMALDSMRAGKDLYLEKPMTLHWDEAKEVYEESKKLGRLIQVGNGGASSDLTWKAREAIESGAIGQVIWSQASAARNSKDWEWNWDIDPGAHPDAEGIDKIDWKAFLGPAPDREWDPERYFRFRKFWDYSGGIATDLIYHSLGHLSIALKAEFPEYVVGMGGIWAQPDREVPDTFMFDADYPSKHSINIPTSMASSQGVPAMIRGQKGTIYYPTSAQRTDDGRGWLTIRAEPAFRDEFIDMNGAEEVRIIQEDRDDHMDNFIDCVFTRKQPTMNAERGYKVAVSISMSVLSYRKRKMLYFDSDKEMVMEEPPITI